MLFAEAVAATPQIRECYRNGLNALGGHRSKIILRETRHCEGSVNLDVCLAASNRDENRWDYCFGYKGEAFFVEVHPAHTSDVRTVIDKLIWLKGWLRNHAPEIDRLQAKAAPAFYWLQTNGFHIVGSRYQRLADEAGIRPLARLELKH